MSRIPQQLTFGVIIGNRGFFPSYLVAEAREQAQVLFANLGINTVMLDDGQTHLGGVETRQDAKICAELFRRHRDDIHGVVVLLPNFGDEKAVAEAIRLSGLNVPVLVQAQEDNLDKMGLATRRDSFCGKISLCNNLRQYGIPFTLTSQHVCALDGDVFAADLQRFTQICRVVKSMQGVRIGAIGARPASFNTVRYSEKLLEKMGVAVETLDLSEIFTRIKHISDGDLRVNEKRGLLLENADASAIPADKLTTMAKLFVVISEWIVANDIDTTAIQCWTSLQENLGINVCSIMSVMSGQLMPSACEVDVMGALSMYALASCSLSPASIADWNNNFGDDRNKCVLFHCGNFASSSLESPSMGTADIIGTTVGKENTCGAVHGRMKSGPLTYFRLSSDDFTGEVKAYVGEGQSVDDPLDTVGCRAVIEVPHLENLLAWICNNGFEHHVAMNHSATGAVLQEAFSKYLGVNCYLHR
ncbi:L-fucose/L-arabinose isomerase family protein [Enterobacteriaceae bacterium H18W14]|uniref:L-fucose/L-arabinose isomerase family protein n=1 Tax=Dryocola boscaweniae TaxID=2925397 RepID=UPI0022F10C10|nr:L-fucose/L-arabinose isomerase family protein [Dryocola boscaweniae]MCT4717076.1 L-fucose/L-arabinose isomerase family protein [Dryocola boscaweniae]